MLGGGPDFGPLCEILGTLLFGFGFASLPFIGPLMLSFFFSICKS